MVIPENTPAGVMRMTRAGRSSEGMQPLSTEHGKPGKSRGVGREQGVLEGCSACIIQLGCHLPQVLRSPQELVQWAPA